MTDFRALINAVDNSPNAGSTQSRPLSRVFAFKTSLPISAIEATGSIRSAELRNMEVGETFEVHGPGYIRFYELTGKQGDFCEFRRIGTENGPDPVIRGVAQIAPGEVFVHVPVEALQPGGNVYILPVNCDVPFWVTAGAGGFDIDVKTADIEAMNFEWQVTL